MLLIITATPSLQQGLKCKECRRLKPWIIHTHRLTRAHIPFNKYIYSLELPVKLMHEFGQLQTHISRDILVLRRLSTYKGNTYSTQGVWLDPPLDLLTVEPLWSPSSWVTSSLHHLSLPSSRLSLFVYVTSDKMLSGLSTSVLSFHSHLFPIHTKTS